MNAFCVALQMLPGRQSLEQCDRVDEWSPGLSSQEYWSPSLHFMPQHRAHYAPPRVRSLIYLY